MYIFFIKALRKVMEGSTAYATLEDFLGEKCTKDIQLEFTDEEKLMQDHFWRCVEQNKPFVWPVPDINEN